MGKGHRPDHGTANVTRAGFTLVHGDQAGQRPDTETGYQTAHGNLVPLGVGGHLHDDADHVDDTPEGDGDLAAEDVRKGSGEQRSEERSDGELVLSAGFKSKCISMIHVIVRNIPDRRSDPNGHY